MIPLTTSTEETRQNLILGEILADHLPLIQEILDGMILSRVEVKTQVI